MQAFRGSDRLRGTGRNLKRWAVTGLTKALDILLQGIAARAQAAVGGGWTKVPGRCPPAMTDDQV
jgi:hypothetical protein